MRRFSFLSFLVGGVLGTAVGVAIGFFVFPYVFPPPAANEVLGEGERRRTMASGMFIHADPRDPVHHGRGRVIVSDRSVFLESDFEVGPGPAFRVYLSERPMVRRSSDVKEAPFVDLGQLRAFKGSQRYALPDGVDLSKYRSVVIWCAQFSVLISPADLTPTPGRT
jgi:hypothetical protein